MPSISIDRIKKLRNASKARKTKERVTIRQRLIELLKRRNEFLDMDEIRLATKIKYRILYGTLTPLVRKGVILRLYVDGRAFYGLPEFLK